MDMLCIKDITCDRGGVVLFPPVSFCLNKGEMLQIIGGNGRGKTTLLKTLIGLNPPCSGTIMWSFAQNDKDAYSSMRPNLMWIGHHSGMNSTLSAEENIEFYHPYSSPYERWLALEMVSLNGYEDVQLAKLSAGQQRRVTLARLWLSHEKVWVLDEPFTALDKKGCELLAKRMLTHIASDGIIVYTTHRAIEYLNDRNLKLELGIL
ncbi:cytochrome c biogenesis heme-transporting ATPase CcmA [Klebsiella aerogenes]|uniref:Cytochrome c biogenesis heme-transporting ATPase CcmA n=1 Tax=Klebsiella aerogenes TaxID=548 RepID=A0AAP9R1Z3_KLEAE|nr:cytochrome c biogenesis heme-transporting ATPase CcmA [Klebsiella aerogenes]QMR43111.1 cytochrome c biogenesis heme-transporting ATPase CcmA [Klebsiella aerogenes]